MNKPGSKKPHSKKVREGAGDPEEAVDRMLENDPNGPMKYLLWGFRLKATSPRIEVIRALSDEPKPASIDHIHKKLGGTFDPTTIYRTLETFSEKGIVNKMHLDAAHALYELSVGRAHHHHAMCTACGMIEDVAVCEPAELNNPARLGLKKFRHIQSHSLEFFGLCRTCEAKK